MEFLVESDDDDLNLFIGMFIMMSVYLEVLVSW